ncbi:MAG: hypothetical protein C0467_10735 [Planctomycetaceae bacterium]|nr:hypothetical protein [Planctomycetaceae bacterium]
MYGMVLMVAITGSGDTASFGKRGGGCSGCTGEVAVSSGCDGAKHHFRGGCGGGGFLGLRNKDKGGCTGCTGAGCTGAGCTGVPAGCTGVVVAAPAPAPVAAPCAPACDPCAAPACEPAKKKGLFARLCHKKDKCEAPAPACTTCATPAVVVPPATVPATMPPVTKKEKE